MNQAGNTVRFVLDGAIMEATSEQIGTSVLDYIREHLHRTGTKEGCAEGDCGACVVLVGELNTEGTAVDYVPVNSCLQFVPTLHGKSIRTVESLRRANGDLHPVQQAMADSHATQCGYCTPGIVMSLTGLLQTVASPTRDQINDALSGNLCRCTGYRPIIDAALQAGQTPTAELKLDDSADLPQLLQLRANPLPLALHNAPDSEFTSPKTVAQLADYLIRNPDAILLAGSTELGPKVNKLTALPKKMVYLGQISELRLVKDLGTFWRIGAQVSLTTLMPLVKKVYPDFAEVLRRFGSPPIRSTATLAGNIANGSPIGDSIPCLLALGATLLLRQGGAIRSLDLALFYTGQKKTALRPGEFIEAVDLPKPAPEQVFRAHKVSKRFDQDISATCCAMSYQLLDGKFSKLRLAYNGMAPSPCRATRLENLIDGRSPGTVNSGELDQAIADSFTARDGLRASWAYRSLLARNLVLQFIEEAATTVDGIAP